ncbi:MAG: sigma-70 family RNA polymerase sigma factor [Actinobacteria bacterium]|nr:sigma-70 family RNA polymerase sigma factor [Actinomycetota bacterium]
MLSPNPRDLSLTELEALHRRFYETRQPADQCRLLEHYEGLAFHLASRATKRPSDHDDLVQVALIALVTALDQFDPHRGVTFTTFAWITIRGHLNRWQRDHGWSVRVPRSLQERCLRTSLVVEQLSHELGRPPRMVEIAQRMGSGETEVRETLQAQRAYLAFPIPAGDDASSETALATHDTGFSTVDDRSQLRSLLARLPDDERELIELRFVEELTQSEIAARLNSTQVRISRQLARSLAKLRAWAEADRQAALVD